MHGRAGSESGIGQWYAQRRRDASRVARVRRRHLVRGNCTHTTDLKTFFIYLSSAHTGLPICCPCGHARAPIELTRPRCGADPHAYGKDSFVPWTRPKEE